MTWINAAVPAGRTRVFMRSKESLDFSWKWQELAAGFELGKDSVKVTIPKDALVDKVIVTNDPNCAPKTRDDRFPAPAPLADVKASVAADGLVTLAWAKPAGLDFSHVEIFVGSDPNFVCENRTALGAVTAAQEPRFCDWGLKPGAKAFYKLVAVSTQDVRGEPVTVSADIPPVAQIVSIEIDCDRAKATGKFERAEVNGEPFMRPWPTQAVEKADPAAFLPLAFPFDLPVDGTYSIWVRYSPGWTPRLAVATSLDGGAPGDWPVRPPYRPMSTMYGRGRGEPKVYSDRLAIGAADVFALKAGAHTLEFRLDPTIPDDQVHGIAKVWVTNDPSFRPEGFDVRADFRK